MKILAEQQKEVNIFVFFFQAEDGIRDYKVTGVQTCALPISSSLVWVPGGNLAVAFMRNTVSALADDATQSANARNRAERGRMGFTSRVLRRTRSGSNRSSSRCRCPSRSGNTRRSSSPNGR